jgi:FAD dependent oxidoreductase TIGR03364
MTPLHNGPRAIVIGAGIVGLAMARSLSGKGYRVTVFERHPEASGASIRNFGMVWPIGQPEGTLYARALRTREIWKETAKAAGLWFEEAGSLHLAYSPLEASVMQEVTATQQHYRPVKWLGPDEAAAIAPGANRTGLLGALHSSDEMIIESRVAIRKLPRWLHEIHGIIFHFNTAITEVHGTRVRTGNQWHEADKVVICSGADFETLYPEIFAQLPITKCKLQMMRIAAQPGQWRIGPALCGGLSLIHYKGFESAPSLNALKKHFEINMPEYLQWGIHVMVSQNGESELTIGDSHEYGLALDPFDKSYINTLILDYLKQFAIFKNWTLQQAWHGIYPKMKDGSTEIVLEAEKDVWIVNGLGGAGMTLSFGLAEEVAAKHF